MLTVFSMITRLHHELAGPSTAFLVTTTLISVVAIAAVVIWALRMRRT